jgi:surface carbohydrate biosynthesis protein
MGLTVVDMKAGLVVPHLILPVETAARELDAKLLVALFAADRGMKVTLGNKALLNLRIGSLQPGVYLSHNFNAGRDRIISIAKQLGHQVVAWDEEGLVWINEESYRRRRADENALRNLEEIFLWGDEQAEALRPLTENLLLSEIRGQTCCGPNYANCFSGRSMNSRLNLANSFW